MFWDFLTLQPQTVHQLMFTFSDRGTPDGYRFMHGYGSHTFKLVNHDNHAVYCKFHYKVQRQIIRLSGLLIRLMTFVKYIYNAEPF